MKEFPAANLVHILARIEALEKTVLSSGVTISVDQRNQLKQGFQEINGWMNDWGASPTKTQINKLINDISTLSESGFQTTSNMVRGILAEELAGLTFFKIDSDDAKSYLNRDDLAGSDFETKFPKGNNELTEAGNCFAFDRFTGCVCHCMRALEYALNAFEKDVGAIPTKYPRMWGNIITDIETVKKSPTSKWKSKKVFYDSCLTYLDSVKTAWRNQVFHVEAIYGKQEAKDVLDSTIRFLRSVAKELSE
ncbi:MAG: hypothetical protein V4507_05925 [Verrucomicrobiota bacterium]